MIRFQEIFGQIQLVNASGQKFECSVDEFVIYEPSYQRLSAPALIRVWTTDRGYCSDGLTQIADDFYTSERLTRYVNKLMTYQTVYTAAHTFDALPVIYTSLTLTGGDGLSPVGINNNEPNQNSLEASFKVFLDPDHPDQSIITSFEGFWRVTIRKIISRYNPYPIDSSIFNVLLSHGQGTATYMQPIPGNYCITDEDFATIHLGGDSYQVRLVNGPVYFVVY